MDDTSVEPTEDEIRRTPLTRALFAENSRSAHAFWKCDLSGDCHKGAAVDATYYSRGAIEIQCHECKKLLGCILVAAE